MTASGAGLEDAASPADAADAATAGAATNPLLATDGRWRRLSHEIATPLNALLGHLDLLLDGSLGPLTPEVRASLHDVQKAARDVGRQASLLLLLAQVKGATAERRAEQVELRGVFTRAWQAHGGWRAGGDLRLEIPAGFVVTGEPETLQSMAETVVDLYLDNAAGSAVREPRCLRLDVAEPGALRIAWADLEPADLPAVHLAMLEALVKRQGARLEMAPGRLVVRWPVERPAGDGRDQE